MTQSKSSSTTSWRARAACGPETHHLFFQTATKAARNICEGCPVRKECLAYALDNDEKYGVWGGTTAYQRYKMKKEQENAARND